ncbi:MAG: ATP-binding protein [Trueperaceae bacterium]|nr:ATP-binding protein [Trueperaceae bacterium]
MPNATAEGWLDGLAEGVVRVRDGRVTHLNAAASSMLGADPDRSVGLALIAVVRDHRLEQVWLDGDPQELTVRGRRIEAVRIEGGLALRDVTAVRAARQDARELLAVLSHELRTPATTIRSTLEALQYDDLPAATRRRLLLRAGEEADRLVRLLSDLTVDLRPPRERSVVLADLLERACFVLAARLTEHGVRVERHVGEVHVWADPDKVMQVLVNLIENAVVHGPDDAVVDVLAEERDGKVAIRVRDRGEPLDDERSARLFEPHAKGTASQGGGTGLGLYVVRSIAERWGGSAWGARWHDADGAEGAGGEGAGGNEFGVLVPAERPGS